MQPSPDSPFLVLPLGVACALLTYACHRIRKRLHRSESFVPDPRLKGVRRTGVFKRRRTWPFRDEYQVVLWRRRMLDINMLAFQWGLAVTAVIVFVVYPIFYLRWLLQ